jgi:hypothetical protein
MAEEGFEQRLRSLVRARRREPGRILGEVGKGILRGAAGLQYTPPPGPDDASRMASLTQQYEALSELEGAAGGDPAKMAEQKLDFLATLVGEARQRLNKKADVYSKAQFNKAKLLLDNLDKQVDNQRELVKTLEPSKRGGGAGGDPSGVDMNKVSRTFASITKDAATAPADRGMSEIIHQKILQGRLNPAEIEIVLTEMLPNPDAYIDAPAEPGSDASLESAYQRIEREGERFADGGGVPAVVSAVRRRIEREQALAAKIMGAPDPDAEADRIPDPELRRQIKEMHFQTDEEGKLLVDRETGRPVLKDTAAMATERRLTAQGLERSYGDMANTINQLVTGSGGGDFANEMKDILGAYGAGSVEELFSRYGLDSASLQAREDALRGKYGKERADIAAELRKLAVAPKAPVARAAFEAMQDPSFSAEMKKRGYEDPAAGLRAMARETGREMRAERKETRQQARARLARPRVEAAMREKLYGQRGPQAVDT